MTRSLLPRRPARRSSRRLLPLCLTGILTLALSPHLFPTVFVRGDVNADLKVDISDPVRLLVHLFIETTTPTCADAADANDDGVLAISDAVRVLRFLFQGKQPPVAPFPDPGSDPTADHLDCERRSSDSEPFVDEERFPEPNDALMAGYSILENVTGTLDNAAETTALGDVIVVSSDTFNALDALPFGGSIYSLQESGVEMSPVVEWLHSTAPPPGAPQATRARIVVPVGGDRCWVINPKILAGRWSGFHGDRQKHGAVPGDANDDGHNERHAEHKLVNEPDQYDGFIFPEAERGCGLPALPDPLPPCDVDSCINGVSLSVSPEQVCGFGTHEVVITASDPDGKTNQSVALITLCDEKDPSCLLTRRRTSGQPLDETSGSATCAWLVAANFSPESPESNFVQTNFKADGKILDVRYGPPFRAFSSSLTGGRIIGPGPVHHVFSKRRNSNCKTPGDPVEQTASGYVEWRANVVCLSPSGTREAPKCASSLELETIYNSTLEASSASGDLCSGSTGHVEALALDEVVVQVSDEAEPLIAKGATVQNGNQVSTTPYFELAAKQPERGGPLPDLALRYGISKTIVRGEGSRSDGIDAFANKKMSLPMTFHMRSKGIARIIGEKRTAATARVTSRIAGLWVVGTSDCPEVGNISGMLLFGESEALAKAVRRATLFFRTRLGRP